MKRKIITMALVAITSITSQLFAQSAVSKTAGYDLKKNVKCRVIPSEGGCVIAIEYDVKSPRDAASGLATGRRQSQPASVKQFFEVSMSNNAVSEVKSPRDVASGLATGKRMHKPYTISKEYDKSSPKLAEAVAKGKSNSDLPPAEISIDEPGVQKVSIQDFHFIVSCGGKNIEIPCPDGECDIPVGECPNGTCSAIASWSWGATNSGGSSVGTAGSGRCSVDFLLEIEDGACTAMAINEKGLPGTPTKKGTTSSNSK